MLKQLTEALHSDDIAVVKAALRMYVQEIAEGNIWDARFYWLDQECEITDDEVLDWVRSGRRTLRVIGFPDTQIKELVYDIFNDGGTMEEIHDDFAELMNELWEALDDDTTVLGTT